MEEQAHIPTLAKQSAKDESATPDRSSEAKRNAHPRLALCPIREETNGRGRFVSLTDVYNFRRKLLFDYHPFPLRPDLV